MRHLSFVPAALLLGSLLLAASLGSTASAQTTLYWDGNGNGTVDGGTGSWNTTATSWSTDTSTSSGTVWDNTAPIDDAVFQNTAGTVTLDSDITVRSLTFGTTGYTLSGANTLTLDGGTGIIDTGSGDQSIAVAIAGNDGLTKSGSGTLTLSGANAYTGGSTVKSGTLNLASGGSISHALSDFTIGAASGDVGALQLSGGTLTNKIGRVGLVAGSSGSATISGGTWTNSLLWVGAGGSVLIDGGYVSAAGLSEIIGTGTVSSGTLATSGQLIVGGSGSTGSFLINGGLVTNTKGSIGRISDETGSVTVTSGTWTNSAELYVGESGTGSLLVNGGAVTNTIGVVGLGAASNGSATVTSGTWANSTSLTVGNGGIGSLEVSGGEVTVGDTVTNTGSASLTIGNSGTGSLMISGGSVSVNGNTISGSREGSTGSITLSGSEGNRGTLSTNLIWQFQGAGTVTFDGGILQARVDQSNFIGWFEPGDVTIDAGGAFIDSNGFAIGITTTVLGGTGGLTKLGAGTLTLSGAHTYTGGTTVEAGTLSQGASGAFASNTAYTVNGGTLDLNDLSLTASSLNGTGGSVDLGSATLIVDQSSTTSFGGAISGTGSLTKQGSGTLALSGTSTHSGGTTISAGTLQVSASALPGNITNNAALVFDQATADTFAGLVSGSGTVAKQGLGNLTVSSAQTYTGGTTVKSGTLTLGSGGSISHSAATTVVGDTDGDLGTLHLSGGTLSNGNATIGNAAGSQGSATVTSGTWTNSGTLTTGLNVGSTGSLTLSGTSGNRGTLSTNQIAEGSGTGTVTFDGGILQARVDQSDFISAFESGDVTINAGGAFIDSNGHTVGISSVLDGTGALTKQGTGTLTLSANNTYTGGTTVNSGLIHFASGANLGTGAITLDGGGLQWADGNTLDVSNRLAALGSAGGAFDTNSNNVTLATAMSGTGRLTKQGTGTLTLSGANNYSGGTTVTTGTLAQGASGAFAANTAYTVNGGGTLDLNDFNLTASSLNGSSGGSVDLGNASLTVNQSGSTSYSGVISGTGSVVKLGTGNLNLYGANTYTGATIVRGGTLNLGNGGSISSPAADLFIGAVSGDDGALRFTGGTVANTNAMIGSGTGSQGSATVNFGTWTNSGTLWIGHSGTGSLLIDAGSVTSAAGVLGFTATTGIGSANVIRGSWTNASNLLVGRAGSGSLAVSGSGLVTVEGITYTGFFGGSTGSITLSGTSGNRGTLATNQVAENSGSGTVIFDGGILQARVDQSDFISAYESGDVTINAGGAFIDSNGFAIGISTALSGTGGLTKQGTGTLTLSGNNTYAGGTTVEAGTLSRGTSAAFANDTAYTVNGGTLDLNNLDLTASSLSGAGGSVDLGTAALTINQSTDTTYTGVISGTGALTKQGSGILTLSGTNTYSGVTTVNGGLIGFTSADSLGTGAITLDGGGLQWATGNTLDLSARLNPLGSAGATFDTNGNDVTLATAMSGTGGGLTKQGAGTLTLSAANTYTGGTTVNGGLIAFASGDNLGTGAITLDGGGLKWATSNTLDISDRLNAIGAAGATFDTNGNNVTFASTMSSTGGLTKDGTGTLTQGVSGAFASNVGYTVNAGTLDLNDFDLSASALSGAGGVVDLGTARLTVDQSSDTTYAGAILGTGGLTKDGLGMLALSGTNAYSGGTTISAGTLQGSTASLTGDITNHAALVFDQATTATFAGDISGSGTLTKQGAGALTLSGSHSYSGSTTISAGTLQVSLSSLTGNITNGAALVIDQATSSTYAADISGTGTVTKKGVGSLTLSGTNTYTGRTTVEAGTLTQGATDAFAQSAAYTVNGGTLDLNDFDLTARSLSGTGGVVDLGTATLTVSLSRNTGSTTYAGVIQGTGGLNKTGGNFVLTLSGPNTYTGGTTLSAGKLLQGASGAFTSNTAYTVNSGTLDLNDFNLTASSLSGTGGAVDLGTARLTVAQSSNTSYAGAISGTGGLTKQGAGTLTLSGTHSYTGGTTLSGGTLAVSADTNLGSTSGALSFGGGTLNSTASFTTNRATALGAGGGTFNVDHNTTLTLNGNLTGAAGNPLTKIGTGTLVLGGTNSYGGDTRVDVGTLRLGAAGALSPNTHLRVQPGAMFDPNGFATSLGRLEGDGNVNLGSGDLSLNQADDTTFAGIIAGTGGLNKSGPGRLTLSGNHTFTGDTDVSAGELRLNGSAASSAFNITGGRLSGSGTLGQLTLGNGGTLAPGNSPGTLSASDTTWEGGATFEWEVNNAAGIVSTNWDILNITGALTITATDANPFSINLVSLTAGNIAGLVPNFDANADASWTFVTTTTGITLGSGASIGASFALNTAGFQNTLNGTFGIAQDGNDLNITYTTSAVPEPSTFAILFGLVALGFTATRRRRA